MKIEDLIEKIEENLEYFITHIEYEKYLSLIKENKELSQYDFILGEYIDYDNVPEEYKMFFTESKLNSIIEYLENKKDSLKWVFFNMVSPVGIEPTFPS